MVFVEAGQWRAEPWIAPTWSAAASNVFSIPANFVPTLSIFLLSLIFPIFVNKAIKVERMTELPPFPFVRIQRSDPMLLLLLLEVNLKTTTAAVLQFSQNKENMEMAKMPLSCLLAYLYYKWVGKIKRKRYTLCLTALRIVTLNTGCAKWRYICYTNSYYSL